MSRLKSTIRGFVAAIVLASQALGAQAQIAKPSSVDILFERKHLTNVDAGADLVYRFQRTVSSTELLGQPFSDDIKVHIKKAGADGTRDVVVNVFTGERGRDPQTIDELSGNPILVVFLDRAIASYMSVAGGKIAYLKDKLRTALRERSTVDPVKVKLAGKTIDAYRVSVTPYAGDLNAQKMRGYENARFSIVVSEAVPGHFVELSATYDNNDKAAPRLEERTLMVGAEVMP